MNNHAKQVPIAVSARHVHLTERHIEALFGNGATLTKDFDLSQPGQFAAKERVAIKGPKGILENVRVIGPACVASQVEISKTDRFILGVIPPICQSDNLSGSEQITIIEPRGEIHLKEGCIIDMHIDTDEGNASNLVRGYGLFVKGDE